MLRVCSWCQTVVGTKPGPADSVTHTICMRCLNKEKRRMDRRMAIFAAWRARERARIDGCAVAVYEAIRGMWKGEHAYVHPSFREEGQIDVHWTNRLGFTTGHTTGDLDYILKSIWEQYGSRAGCVRLVEVRHPREAPSPLLGPAPPA